MVNLSEYVAYFSFWEKGIDELYPCLVFDEDMVEEARFGGQRDPVASDRIDDFGRALVDEGEDGVGVPLLLEVVLERGVQHLVEGETPVNIHLGNGFFTV